MCVCVSVCVCAHAKTWNIFKTVYGFFQCCLLLKLSNLTLFLFLSTFDISFRHNVKINFGREIFVRLKKMKHWQLLKIINAGKDTLRMDCFTCNNIKELMITLHNIPALFFSQKMLFSWIVSCCHYLWLCGWRTMGNIHTLMLKQFIEEIINRLFIKQTPCLFWYHENLKVIIFFLRKFFFFH